MGIRTPDTLVGYTRFPIVLLKPDSDISPLYNWAARITEQQLLSIA